jgi:hypothetical protein
MVYVTPKWKGWKEVLPPQSLPLEDMDNKAVQSSERIFER